MTANEGDAIEDGGDTSEEDDEGAPPTATAPGVMGGGFDEAVGAKLQALMHPAACPPSTPEPEPEPEPRGGRRQVVASRLPRKHRRVVDYLHGLRWNISMLRTGTCPDYGYFYRSRQPPSFRQIREYHRRRASQVSQSELWVD
jgi:hypothetical protein